MKRYSLLLPVLIISAWLLFPAQGKSEEINIDKDWLFMLEDVPAAKGQDYDDSGWRKLDLPHDWAFENGFSETGAQGERGGYAGGGTGWYRKHLHIPSEFSGKRLFLDFDAVYMNSEVWINGHRLGKRPYGYISFSYEISKYIEPGDNIISVRVDNSLEPSARWYHGCGIYGSVYLRAENELHFIKDGIHVRTPEISRDKGIVRVGYELSDAEAALRVEAYIRKDGKTVAAGNADIGNPVELQVSNPELWSPDSPELYEIDIRVIGKDGKKTDREVIGFGFRTISWDAGKGFFLNGENLKLRGVCEHLEGGPVGAAWTEDLMAWKLKILKDMGCNAIRTAHNPQLPFFYRLCDEMGILVMDEAFDGWKRKAEHDYGAQAFDEWWERDLRAMIRRDRNHPCVFIYSIGNETKGKVAAEMVRVCHEEDPDRMVTSGHSAPEVMDVTGVNGHSEKKSFLLSYKPGEKAFIGTETPHTWQVRGFYRTRTWYRDGYPNKSQDPFEIPDLTDKEIFGYDWTSPEKKKNPKQVFNSSYDNATVRLTARHNLAFLRDLPWYSGHFRWTGFDYLGEAGYVHGGWPFRAFMGGVVDLAGFKKDHYYLYQSEWRDDIDMVHILPHWTHPDVPEGTLIPVWIYTTGDSAELLFNGKSLGVRHKGTSWDEIQCEWMVPWHPGELTAIAYRDGKEICRTSVRSASAGTGMQICMDRINDDTSIFTFRTVDKDGNLFPYGDNRIWLAIPDGAEIISFENGNPVDTECNFHAGSRRAFFGLCRAFMKNPSGKGTLTAGCICGDRSLKVSDTVTISVMDMNLKTGRKVKARHTIRYTVDGSEPDMDSKIYDGPFRVSKNTTVKAYVFDGKDIVLKLEEAFGGEDCLYWGKPGDGKAGDAGMQAESATLKNASVMTGGNDVHGNGYVSFQSKGGSITWYQENDGSAMTATLRIRYSQEYPDNPATTLEIQNNDGTVGELEFRNTGSRDSSWKYIEVPVRIVSGANYIKLTSTSGMAPNIDEIILLTSPDL